MKLSKEERKAIAGLQSLAKRWPKSLWLFAGSGTLCIMKKGPDGARRMTQDGAVDQGAIVESLHGIEVDGGDF